MDLSAWKQARPAKKAKRKSKYKLNYLTRDTKKPKIFSPVEHNNAPQVSFMDMKFYAPHNTTFNLYPPRTFMKEVEAILKFMKGSTLRQERDYIQSVTTTTFYNFINTNRSVQSEQRKYLRLACTKIRRLRGIFCRFLHRWRVSRLRPTNTEDFFTLEVPKDPIRIVSWVSRSTAVFEASSLMRDITERLMHHDGVFESPQLPRNPFTNLPFTQAQIISVWNQLAASKSTASSAFTNYRQTRWNLHKFSSEYSVPLQVHALRKTMLNTSHYDYKEKMLDFIQYCYDAHDRDFELDLFRMALLKKPDHLLLKSWANLCTKFYECAIIHSNAVHRVVKIQQEVLDRTKNLLNRTTLLKQVFPD
jgi:hypothetical protein